MDNHTGSIVSSIGARAESMGRRAGLPRRSTLNILGTLGFVVIAGLGMWFLFAGQSDRDAIDAGLDRLGLTATFVDEAPSEEGLVYLVERPACGDEVSLTLTAGEAQVDAPRPVLVVDADGSRSVLDPAKAADLLGCLTE